MGTLHNKMKKEIVELTDEIKEEITKNQLARLVIIRMIKHFQGSVEMDKDDFFKYLKEANEEFKEYIKREKAKEKKQKQSG